MDQNSLNSFVRLFVDELTRSGKSQYTTIAYKKDLEQFDDYLRSLGKNEVSSVGKQDIEGFIQSLIQEKNYTKKSASRKLNSIRTFFRFLKSKNAVEINIAGDISHPKYEQAPPRILTKLEYRGLRDASKDDARTYSIIELLLQTGMKIGELANLKLEDIREGELIIRASGKNVSRTIPLNKASEMALKAYIKVRPPFPDTHIFITRTGRPMLIRNIRQIVHRCFMDVGIQNATVNDLRNTFIAHQLTNGASLEYIAKIVGHRRLSSTERFLNLIKTEAEKKERLGEL
ncbi:MAG: tyrosine-type recombinase/integrase [Patescibacteria group bacterium]